MKEQSYITILLIVLMSMTGVKAFAHDFEVKNADGVTIYYNWTNDNQELAVTFRGSAYREYNEYSGNITIPEMVTYNGKTYSVTSIGESAFKRCSSLTSVTIPNSVMNIEGNAFEDCENLTSVTISENVTKISFGTFKNCSNLTSVILPPNLEIIQERAFGGCANLTSLTIPNSVLYIGGYAFEDCRSLISVNIPRNITYIWGNIFNNCSSLPSITIPRNIEWISSPFEGCIGLTSIVVESGNPTYDSRDNCNAIIETATNTLYIGCSTTKIPNSVTSIGASAFNRCSSLTSITIPNSVKTIGQWAFEYCSGLTSINIPNSVTSIGYQAFFCCSGLSSIHIPNSVTHIGSSAFDGTDWYYNQSNGILYLDNWLVGCKDDDWDTENGMHNPKGKINIAEGTIGIAEDAFYYCRKLNSVTIPKSVLYVGKELFHGCTGLNSVVVKNGNPKYDSRDNCNAIIETATNSLVAGCATTQIPNSVTSIGPYAFDGYDYGLTSIKIPNSVTSIGESAFSYCESLTSITIPNSVTTICDDAFIRCNGLTSVTISNSLTSIGRYAFYGCSGLTSVLSLNNDPPVVNWAGFFDVDMNSCVLWVPKGSLNAYKNADVWRDFQNIKELAHGDVNLDSEVNHGDLNALVDYVMGKDPEDFNKSLGDLNGDEKVDAADVVMQVDAIIKAGEYSKNKAPENVEVVDLGLPRGTMWANMNIGAESPEDYGLYFAWGETVGYTSDTSDGRSFDWASYKWMNEGESTGAQVNKYQIADGHTADCWYNDWAEFIGDGKTKLDLEDDAAYVNWGTNWRMPTSYDFQELFENTTYKWTTLNGVNGLMLTSKTNGNTIFLPAAGDRVNSGFWDSSEYGYYWSSSLHVFDSSTASFLIFNWVNPNPTSMADRRCGFTIRPVLRNVP